LKNHESFVGPVSASIRGYAVRIPFDSWTAGYDNLAAFLNSISKSISDTVVVSVLDRFEIEPMDAMRSLAILKKLVRELERLAGKPAA
jgi:hypothetical protein